MSAGGILFNGKVSHEMVLALLAGIAAPGTPGANAILGHALAT